MGSIIDSLGDELSYLHMHGFPIGTEKEWNIHLLHPSSETSVSLLHSWIETFSFLDDRILLKIHHSKPYSFHSTLNDVIDPIYNFNG